MLPTALHAAMAAIPQPSDRYIPHIDQWDEFVRDKFHTSANHLTGITGNSAG